MSWQFNQVSKQLWFLPYTNKIVKERSGKKTIGDAVQKKKKDQETKEEQCEWCWMKTEEKEETQVFFTVKQSTPFHLH